MKTVNGHNKIISHSRAIRQHLFLETKADYLRQQDIKFRFYFTILFHYILCNVINIKQKSFLVSFHWNIME